MSDKLQQGDYVTDLTEEQFQELINIQNDPFPIMKKTYIGFNGDHLSTTRRMVTKLTYDEFKQRAINTFT